MRAGLMRGLGSYLVGLFRRAPGERGAVIGDAPPSSVPRPSPGWVEPAALLSSAPATAPAGPDVWDGSVPMEAVALSEVLEGRYLRPYLCQAGRWTIGIGSTTDWAGKPITAKTPPITDATADAWAARDLEKAARLVRKALPGPIVLTRRQAAALILLANNLGDLTVAAPTLVRAVKGGDWRFAAGLFRNYRNAGGKPSLGLRRRRWAEAAFSLGMAPKVAYDRAWSEITTPDGWPVLPG